MQCHTVGFDYETGYMDDKKTPNLKHVGCENCHGPGSGHVADPKAQNLHQYLSPWKRGQAGNLLPIDLIKKLAVTPREDFGKIAIQPADQLMMNLVGGMCAKCHDADNDPNFEFPKYWPKVNHSGLRPPAAGRPFRRSLSTMQQNRPPGTVPGGLQLWGELGACERDRGGG